MILCDTNYPSILDDICDELTKAEIELVFVSSDEMQEINKKERNIDKTTDVLSFPLEYVPHFPIGSIVINIDLASSKSKELGHKVEDEIALLFIHGLLHVLGFDHENDDGEMRRREIDIIEKFSLPKSLIVRSGC
ncbi:rRNA maturation RNase YbeY [Campylobacter hyointestinalis]|uniref:Endoribonuclease YbeY n=2 Tax=Campylobacter hyointestinalis TaxID=198 RepID=A0AAV6EHW0_CAMHY|nr:rRNA maturation RNase YbeY [Campylobacter hyointestinalis]KAB0613191.1 rRNA maturation RNase YbeY [Campylobacter hyointestinalis subsp. lawsonii]QKF69214.1 rRNA maturation RNase [Campylobacter hyointestinalis subsp. lawsonii]RAZ29592.1 rRNA maturation RNase YbeY [Campylobacter hyointestinalis subsp. lawsonii]TWO22665.1 rRNA maturation RNase YbeY [Campylobacter hyointestinalis]